MKYFTYNDRRLDDAISWATNYQIIKARLEEIKRLKDNFKILIKGQNLAPWDLYYYIMKVYDMDFLTLKQDEEEYIMKNFPKSKIIKTDFAEARPYGLHTYPRKKLEVRAKKEVKLNTFKVYTAEEVKQMIESGSIKVIDSIGYGSAKPGDAVYCEETCNTWVAGGLAQAWLDEAEYNKLFAKNAGVVNMFFNDIDFKQIAEDYQTQFLPKYKECLKRLYERAQELQKENADRKKEIEKEKIELAESDENLEKLKTKLQDLTRGR